jgi:hypothetical protein
VITLFCEYFPLLVVLLRATHYCLKSRRTFDYEKAKQGAYQFIWGLVKKVVADTCATYANAFLTTIHMNSWSLILGQSIFCSSDFGDFSGYSDGFEECLNYSGWIYYVTLITLIERYCRVLASLAYILVFLVSGFYIFHLEVVKVSNETSAVFIIL